MVYDPKSILDELDEIGKVAAKSAGLPEAFFVAPEPGSGLRVHIDLDGATFEGGRDPGIYQDWFPVAVRVIDQRQNWLGVLRAARQIKRDIWRYGAAKYRIGDIKREPSDSDFILSIQLIIPDLPYST